MKMTVGEWSRTYFNNSLIAFITSTVQISAYYILFDLRVQHVLVIGSIVWTELNDGNETLIIEQALFDELWTMTWIIKPHFIVEINIADDV